MDWYLEVKIQARDRQYSFCVLIQETKNIRILKRLTWVYHVVHNTCITHGRNFKTRYFGLMLILQFGKVWHSVRLDRMQSSFKKHFQLIIFRKLVGWRLEKSFRKSIHPPKISLKHEWKRELGSEHTQRAEAGQLSRSFQSNQPTLNPIRETSGRTDITHDVICVQDERKTSRSQEIDVNSFREELCSSERTGRPVTGKPVHETSVIQKGFQRWTGTWATCYHAWRDQCVR